MIKVTLGEQPNEEKPFPKLATLRESGGVFLALSKTDIICLASGSSGWAIGEQDDRDFDWNMSKIGDCFIEYNNPVTLQNA